MNKNKNEGDKTQKFGRCLNQFERSCLKTIALGFSLLGLGLLCYACGFIFWGALYTVINIVSNYYFHHDLITSAFLFWTFGIAFVWGFFPTVRGTSETGKKIRARIDRWIDDTEEKKFSAVLGDLQSAQISYSFSSASEHERKLANLRNCRLAVISAATCRWGKDWQENCAKERSEQDRQRIESLEWTLGNVDKLEVALKIYKRPDLCKQVVEQQVALTRFLRAVIVTGKDVIIEGKCPVEFLLKHGPESAAHWMLKTASTGIRLGSSDVFISVKLITQGEANLTVTVRCERSSRPSAACDRLCEQLAMLSQELGLAPEPIAPKVKAPAYQWNRLI